jgi:hypothetical protein
MAPHRKRHNERLYASCHAQRGFAMIVEDATRAASQAKPCSNVGIESRATRRWSRLANEERLGQGIFAVRDPPSRPPGAKGRVAMGSAGGVGLQAEGVTDLDALTPAVVAGP